MPIMNTVTTCCAENTDVFDIFWQSAGSDTSANTLAQLFRQLALHPDVASAVRSEIRSVLAGRPPADVTPEDVKAMRLLNACINETLRLVPAAPELVRLSKEDDRLGPFDVPAGN